MPTELIPAPFAQRLPYLPMPAMSGMSRPMNVPGAIQPNGIANPWAMHNALETYQPRLSMQIGGAASIVGSVYSDGGIRGDDGWAGSAGRSSVGYAPDPGSAVGPQYGPMAYQFQHAPSSFGNHHPQSAAGFAMRSRAGSVESVYSESPMFSTPVYATPSPRPRRISVHAQDDCRGHCAHYKPAPANYALEVPRRRNSGSRRAPVVRDNVSPFSSSPLKNEAEYMPAPPRRRSGNGGRCNVCERGCGC